LRTEASLLAEVIRKENLHMRGNQLAMHGVSLPFGQRFQIGWQHCSGAPELR
jgi:hypothetical protein